MAMLVKGLGYGLVAAGTVASFAGGMIVFCSVCCFLCWIGGLLLGVVEEAPDPDDNEEE